MEICVIRAIVLLICFICCIDTLDHVWAACHKVLTFIKDLYSSIYKLYPTNYINPCFYWKILTFDCTVLLFVCIFTTTVYSMYSVFIRVIVVEHCIHFSICSIMFNAMMQPTFSSARFLSSECTLVFRIYIYWAGTRFFRKLLLVKTLIKLIPG